MFLVCDHSKLGRTAPARLASLSEVSAVFTDKPFPDALALLCKVWRTQIHCG